MKKGSGQHLCLQPRVIVVVVDDLHRCLAVFMVRVRPLVTPMERVNAYVTLCAIAAYQRPTPRAGFESQQGPLLGY